MGLSDDQRAMLRLLAQREEGYEDIAALMGIGVDEVRARVKEALAGLQSEQRPTGTRPPVAPRPLPPETEGAPPAPRVPEPQAPAAKAPTRAPSAARRPPSLSKISLPKGRRRLAEPIGGAVVVILIVLFATGALDIGGGGSESGGGPSGASTERQSTAAANSSRLTQAVLEPVDGSDASGRALFGRIRKSVVLQVEARGLDPSPPGQSYTVWLYRSPKLVLRIGAVRVGKPGTLAAQFPIPTELLRFIASGAFDQIDISLTPDSAYRAELATAKRNRRLPGYIGVDVLRGKITGPAIR